NLHGQPARGRGTGLMVDPDGFLVTNFHVISNAVDRSTNAAYESAKLEVQFDNAVDTRTYTALLVSYVERDDLALLKIAGERQFLAAKLGISSDLMIGERVVAIGNPFQQKLSVSTGIISGLHREIAVAGSRYGFTDLIP